MATFKPKSQMVVEDIVNIETEISADEVIKSEEDVAKKQGNLMPTQEPVPVVEITKTLAETSNEITDEVSNPVENVNVATKSDNVVTPDAPSVDESITDTKIKETVNQIADEPIENKMSEAVEGIEEKASTQPDEDIVEKTQAVEDVKATEVVPETLFDEIPQAEQPQASVNVDNAKIEVLTKDQNVVETVPVAADKKAEVISTKEDIINKAKQAFENKQKTEQQKKEEIRKKVKYLSDNIEELSKNQEFRQVLEAPVAQGSNLSPQELKKQYHKNLIEAADKAKNDMNIEVKVIENK